MSEDQTKLLSNDENKSPTSQPMLEMILAKMSDLVKSVHEGFAEANAKIDALAVEVQDFRVETGKNFRTVNNKFSILTDQVLEVQAKQRELETRLDDLERKAS